MNPTWQRVRADFVCSAAQNAYGASAPASPQPALRRQGAFCADQPKSRRNRVFTCARPWRALAVRNINLIRAKAFAKDKGSIGSEGVLCRLSDLMSTFGRKLGKFQENNAERTKVREHCCLASFRRRTGCSPPFWRSRQCEHRKTLPSFSGATLQPARISGAQGTKNSLKF